MPTGLFRQPPQPHQRPRRRLPLPPASTDVGEVSLGAGSDPGVDTGHNILVRARVTSGAGSAVLGVALYESSNNRSGDLYTSTLMNSLANYTVAISEAAAATITSYSSLSIRFWGYDINGVELVYEVDYLALQTPPVVGGSGSFTADAVIKRTQTGSFTVDAILAGAGAGSFTANATIKRTQSASLTADAVIFRNQTGSTTANAVVKRTQASSFTADAVLLRTQSGSFSANAVVIRTQTGSFTVNAIIGRTQTATFTADAIVKKTATGSFSADALITVVGECVWTTPADGVQIDDTPTLAFLMPEVAAGEMHFQIEIDTDPGYSAPLTFTSHSVLTGWEYWDGGGWQPIPQSGVPDTYVGNEARYTLQSPLANGTYYRRVRAGII